MVRQVITESDLVSRINHELEGNHSTSHCSISGVDRLDAPDASGCNWTGPDYVNCGGNPVHVWGARYDQVVQAMREKFNLE